MATPQEAITELEFAVKELKFKAISCPGECAGLMPEVMREAPHLGKYAACLFSDHR
jgi:hypothetical protein